MPSRCPLCSSPSPSDNAFCGAQCAHAAREAAKDGIEARLRRAFARRRRPPAGPPDPEAEQIFFEIEDLWTPGCAGAAEEILRVQPGVLDAYVVPETGRGRAFYDPERISPRDIFKTLRRYGLPAHPVRDAWARAEGFSRAWETNLVVRLGVAATLTIHVMYLSALLAWDRVHDTREAETIAILTFFLTLPVLLYAGWPILVNATFAIARRRVSADLLTAVGILGAAALSIPGVLGRGPLYCDAACAAVVATLFARLCEYRARRRFARTGEQLASLVSGSALRVRRSEESPCTASDLRPGDVVRVTTGARVPADGDVIEGSGVVESPAGGAATELSPGDRVIAGSRLLSGRLSVRAERTGHGTAAGELARVVETAIAGRMPGSAAATRGVAVLGVAIIIFAATAFALEVGRLKDLDLVSLAPLVAVLLAASPAALALFPAVAGLSALGRAAEHGAIARSGEALEAASRADAVVFTRAALVEPRATASLVSTNADPSDLWSVVAALTAVAPGPAAAALRERSRLEGAPAPAGVAAHDGRLARARVDGRDSALGDLEALTALGWTVPASLDAARAEEAAGRPIAWVGWDGELRAAVALDATPRAGAAEAAATLERARYVTALVGPESEPLLQAQAARLGLDLAIPESRAEADLDRRSRAGRTTLLVSRAGPDAPAGSSSTGAVPMALDVLEDAPPDWALVLAPGNSPRAAVAVLGSARRAVVARRTAGTFAFLYHVAVLPCAAAGLISPMVAVGLSAASGLVLLQMAFRAGGRNS